MGHRSKKRYERFSNEFRASYNFSDVQEHEIPPLKIIIVGESGVGKSSLLFRYCHEIFQSCIPTTLGYESVVKKVEIENKVVSLVFWDTAGQERFSTILPKDLYRNAHGVLLVFDLTERLTFTKIPKWLRIIKDEVEEAVIYLIGNQCDLSSQRHVTRQEAESFCQENDLRYAETSAFSGFGIDEAFNQLIVDIIEAPHLWMRPKSRDTIDLKTVQPMKPYKRKRCGLC